MESETTEAPNAKKNDAVRNTKAKLSSASLSNPGRKLYASFPGRNICTWSFGYFDSVADVPTR